MVAAIWHFGKGASSSYAWFDPRRGGLGQYLTRRSLHSLVSLAGLIVLVFFLARLTGDPTNLYLPLDASLQARADFAEKHGFTDPLSVQFGGSSKVSAGSISGIRCARRGRRSRSCSRPFRPRSGSPRSP